MAGRGGRPPPQEDEDIAFSVAGDDDIEVLGERPLAWPSSASELAGEERREGPFRVPVAPPRRRPQEVWLYAADIGATNYVIDCFPDQY